MDFVDEEDDVAFGLFYLVDDGLQTFLELTFVFGSGYQGTHVERIQLFVFQVLRHITTKDSLCQSFDDGGLTGTWFADQDRIVFGTTAQYLQNPTDFFVTADDWIELAVSGGIYQVDGILFQ